MDIFLFFQYSLEPKQPTNFGARTALVQLLRVRTAYVHQFWSKNSLGAVTEGQKSHQNVESLEPKQPNVHMTWSENIGQNGIRI
jgi:hypothetical protein